MKYKAYKLSFPCGVHFGENSLDSSETLFHSDSFQHFVLKRQEKATILLNGCTRFLITDKL